MNLLPTLRRAPIGVQLALAALALVLAATPAAATDGLLDTAFQAGSGGKFVYGSPDELALSRALEAPDGALVVSGEYQPFGGDLAFHWRRFTATASTPTCSLTPATIDSLDYGGAIFDHAGRLVLAGSVHRNGHSIFAVARFLYPACTPDPAFDGDGYAEIDVGTSIGLEVKGLAEVSVGIPNLWRLLVGAARPADGIVVARFLDSGGADTAFGGGDGWGEHTIGALFFLSSVRGDRDGRLLFAGYRDAGDSFDYQVQLVRLTFDGALDTGFNGTGKLAFDFDPAAATNADFATDLAVTSDCRIAVGGAIGNAANTLHRGAVAMVRDNGTLDPSFSGDGRLAFDGPSLRPLAGGGAVVARGDGRIVWSGWANHLDAFDDPADTDVFLARVDHGGALDATFGTGGKSLVSLSGTANVFENGVGVALVGGAPHVAAAITAQAVSTQGGVFRLTETYLFADGFDCGDAAAWSAKVP